MKLAEAYKILGLEFADAPPAIGKIKLAFDAKLFDLSLDYAKDPSGYKEETLKTTSAYDRLRMIQINPFLEEHKVNFLKLFQHCMKAPNVIPSTLIDLVKYNKTTGEWEIKDTDLNLTVITDQDDRIQTLLWIAVMIQAGRLAPKKQIKFATDDLVLSNTENFLIQLIASEVKWEKSRRIITGYNEKIHQIRMNVIDVLHNSLFTFIQSVLNIAALICGYFSGHLLLTLGIILSRQLSKLIIQLVNKVLILKEDVVDIIENAIGYTVVLGCLIAAFLILGTTPAALLILLPTAVMYTAVLIYQTIAQLIVPVIIHIKYYKGTDKYSRDLLSGYVPHLPEIKAKIEQVINSVSVDPTAADRSSPPSHSTLTWMYGANVDEKGTIGPTAGLQTPVHKIG